jgi:Tfp pilus assembly major pilin PilA
VEATICAGENYPFYGEILTETGVYTAVLTSVNGCDSIVQLDLNVLPVATGTESATICAGDSYSFNGQLLGETGTYTAVYTAANGCDSIVTLTLTVTPLPQSVFASVVCGGGSFEFNGEVLTESGVYSFLLDGAAVNGCDSMITLFLTIFPIIPPTSVSPVICAGESYEIDGETLTASGTYTFNLSSSTGCDSVVVVNLTVNPASASAFANTICPGGTYEFNGQILTQPGVYTFTLQNYLGCDSIVTLTLVEDVVAVTVTLNNGELTATSPGSTFQWINCDGNVPIPGAIGSTFTPTATGNYAVIATNSSGCTAVSSCITVVVVSVRDLLSANGWSLQPNPASSYTTVVLKEALTADVALEVFDPAGRLLHQQHIAAGTYQVTLDVSNFPDGMLMIRLMSAEGVSSKLLMKGN